MSDSSDRAAVAALFDRRQQDEIKRFFLVRNPAHVVRPSVSCMIHRMEAALVMTDAIDRAGEMANRALADRVEREFHTG